MAIDNPNAAGPDRPASRWTLDITSDAVLPVKRKGLLRRLKNLVCLGAAARPTSTSPEGGSSGDGGHHRPLRPTAYLDGLRGFAAFLVYWHHNELWAHAWQPGEVSAYFENAWGWGGRFYFATFYGVRNFFTGGHFAVAIFYVISGYVLSMKPLRLIHEGEHLKAADNLGSALFRRWFRLYIPCAVTTLVYVTSWHVFGVWNTLCPPKPTYREELWRWYNEFMSFSFVFKETMVPWVSYNTHLWSIPLEMRGSIVVWTVVLALSRATVRARLLCQLVLIFYFLYLSDGYYGALFVAGMLQADLDMLARSPDGYFPRFLRRLEPFKVFLYYHLFFLSMFLSGVPSLTDDVNKLRANPGWYWLSYLKPQAMHDPKWFFLFWAANMLVACIPRLRWLRRFFESRFCQYLGRISFALYLVHGPVLAIVGDRLYHAVGWVSPVDEDKKHLAAWANRLPLSRAGPLGLELSFLLPHIILLPLTLWVAELTTRWVDEPAVNFAHWLYRRTLGGGDSPPPKPEDAMRLA